ncbi:LysR family transcriptional regulator [Eubacteriaceae bacterium ES2]|nr:LysR family transcriptional regulator [Eubacteriaceae bacterium ES2]
MTFQQMEIFLIVASYGSFTAAAKEVYTTQPTISRQIKLFEDELGFDLFLRNEKPLMLTEAGKMMYDQFSEIVHSINETIKTGKKIAEGKQGNISIAFLQGLYIEDYFSDTLKKIQDEYLDLELTFSKINIPSIREKILSSQVDLLVTLNLSLLNQEDLEIAELFPIQSYILMSRHHPLAQKKALGKNDLLNQTIYLPNPINCFPIVQNSLFGFNIKREKIISVEDIETAFLNVRFSEGITCANNMMHAVYDNEYYKKFPIIDSQDVPKVCMAWKKGNQNPAVYFLKNIFKKALA